MPETSNPTDRVIRVLNFLAAHPTENFSLAEIARHVGLSNGSAHRVLTTLAKAQFLSRNDKRRTYSLGMATIAIGHAAVEKHRGVDIARREISRLALELNVQCSANAVVDGEMLVLVKEGTAQSHLGLTSVGERRPLIPPLGICHLAWSGEAAIAAYVEKVDAYLSLAIREHLIATFPLVRRRGYAIAANGPNTDSARRTMVLPIDQLRDDAYWASAYELVSRLTRHEIQLHDLAAVGPEGISYIAAPVFSPNGSVSLGLLLSGLPNTLGAKDAEHYAHRLRATAALITHETHGLQP